MVDGARVTQIESYKFLMRYWKGRRDEATDLVACAQAEFVKWRDRLDAAELAEEIAKKANEV